MSKLTPWIQRLERAFSSENKASRVATDISRSFGELFRAERQSRGLSPKRMATLLKVGKSMLYSMEDGSRLWTIERARLAVDIFRKLDESSDRKRKNAVTRRSPAILVSDNCQNYGI